MKASMGEFNGEGVIVLVVVMVVAVLMVLVLMVVLTLLVEDIRGGGVWWWCWCWLCFSTPYPCTNKLIRGDKLNKPRYYIPYHTPNLIAHRRPLMRVAIIRTSKQKRTKKSFIATE